ncbi:GNAT family N-acetyltransferase [uncultured Tateyamaria sp.]|uniref:GNAT family N-acetyltransferase n=1 Tax=uncultured Tateyamaria sp. TaxID=455651 RepID=UPI00260F5736|nr:GNAT family N-acetyltransferase [uncultured Tateyamaria sp.]
MAVTRPLRAEDREAWEILWGKYNAFYGRSGPTALPDEVIDVTWQRLLCSDTPVHGLVAIVNDCPVGLAHFVLHSNLIQLEQTCYLQDLYVDDAARGQRISRALMAAIQTFCRKNGIKDMYWHTHASNARARSLYDTVAQDTGFVVYRQRLD